MYSALAAFLLALVVSALLTPIVRLLALQVGAIDTPDERHIHQRAVPRLGGAAVTVAFFVPLLVLFGLETGVALTFYSEPLRIVGLGIGGLTICILGAADDIRGVRAYQKLFVQAAAATLVYFCGFRIPGVTIPFVGTLEMGVFALPVTVLWIVGIVNAMNLIDGLDGLAAGIGFFACAVNLVVGALAGSPLVVLLSAALGGAILGFLFYNFNPATIFLGDSGSMFLGFVLATTSLMASTVKSSTAVAILVPVIALGVPIMDTLLAMARRVVERRPIFAPDRSHIHHRLLEMGVNHRRAVLILYGVSVLFAASAIVLAIGRNWEIGAALLVMSAVALGLFRSIRGFEQLSASRRQRMRIHAPSTARFRQTVPGALSRIRAARDLDELQSEMESFAEASGLVFYSLRSGVQPAPTRFIWMREPVGHGAGNGGSTRADEFVVRVTYQLKRIGNDVLRFGWRSGYGDVSLQDEVLLQLVADAFEARLARPSKAREAADTGRLRPVT